MTLLRHKSPDCCDEQSLPVYRSLAFPAVLLLFTSLLLLLGSSCHVVSFHFLSCLSLAFSNPARLHSRVSVMCPLGPSPNLSRSQRYQHPRGNIL